MEKDLFNFRDYVIFLKDKLEKDKKSHVVGIHGDYGAGKTTTMNLIKKLYEEDKSGIDNILEFSAWRNYYNEEQTVWKALLFDLSNKIYDIFDKLEKDENFEFNNKNFEKKIYSKKNVIKYIKITCREIQYNLYQDLKDFNGEIEKGKSEASKFPFKAFVKSISGLLKSDITGLVDLLKKEEQDLLKPKIDTLEVIQRKFDILLEFYNLIEEKENKKVPPLIIMVDDLDRILPEKSVEILEILRIFFEKSENIHFICAIDIRVIEKGIERKFNQLNQLGDLSRIEFEEYLEKIITLPFDLPAIPIVNFNKEKNIFGIDELINENFEKKFSIFEKIENRIKNGIKVDGDDQKLKELELEKEDKITKEKENIQEVNTYYSENINFSKNKFFKEIIKTGLQANPRKIKRFIDVFEIYFKILIYRQKKYDKIEKFEIEKYSCLLAKMLIIKLEWDELYREFVRDKFYIAFIENISNDIQDEKNDFELTYKITDIIKESKIYKFPSLFGILSIGDKFLDEKSIENGYKLDLLKNIYTIYYLINIENIKENQNIEENENIENIGLFNLLKYLYSNDDNRIKYYIKNNILESKNSNISKILKNYKKILEN